MIILLILTMVRTLENNYFLVRPKLGYLRYIIQKTTTSMCISPKSSIIGIWRVFFLPGFSFTNIHDSQESREMGGYFFNSPYHFHTLHRYLDLSRVITVEKLLLHIASSRTRTRNLRFQSASC